MLAEGLETLFRRWWSFFHRRCLAGFPWFWPSRPLGEQAMVDARYLIRRHFGRDHHPVHRTLARILAAIAWPPAVLIHFWQIRRYRRADEVPIERAPQALWAAMRHNVLPGEYYAYALWQSNRRKNIDNYLYSHEAARLFKLLNKPLPLDPISDKLAFHEMCTTCGLPTPEVLAAFSPTGYLLDFKGGHPPQRDLFVKPSTGLAGLGAERFRWHKGAFESNRGQRISQGDLIKYLTARSRNEKWTLLVQPNLANHPDLCVEPNAALATARLVTGQSMDGDVAPIFGFIYFARSDRITAQHGHVVLIDVVSGRLMQPMQEDRSGPRHPKHQFGSKETSLLPDWHAALHHAKVAHRACPNFVFIGWDIALTDQGPMLLEGNANWSADEYQSLSGNPLGHTQFSDILATRLRHLKPY